MTNSQRLATVRDRLRRWLADQNSQSLTDQCEQASAKPILSESILIRDGFYCGRRFQLGTHRAVWFLEEDVLKIYAADGELACVLTSDEISDTADSEIDPVDSATDSERVIRLPTADPERIDGHDEDDHEIRRAA